MFQFTAFLPVCLCIHHTVTELFSAGFPHSDTHGSPAVCAFPWLFAACCVLLRLLVPRHSPFALLRLSCLRGRAYLIIQPIRHARMLCFTSLYFIYSAFTFASVHVTASPIPAGFAFTLHCAYSSLSGAYAPFLSFVQFSRCKFIFNLTAPPSKGYNPG